MGLTNEFQHSQLELRMPFHALLFSHLHDNLAMQVLVWISMIQLVRSGMALHTCISDDLTYSSNLVLYFSIHGITERYNESQKVTGRNMV